jgi:hypothetical protein
VLMASLSGGGAELSQAAGLGRSSLGGGNRGAAPQAAGLGKGLGWSSSSGGAPVMGLGEQCSAVELTPN